MPNDLNFCDYILVWLQVSFCLFYLNYKQATLRNLGKVVIGCQVTSFSLRKKNEVDWSF